jgi:hypothetical protein
MTVNLYSEPTHKAVVFSYDKSLIKGRTIIIKATNLDSNDTGVRKSFNTGTFVLFYPFDFVGTDHIVVSDVKGKHEDSGIVTIS